MIHCPGCGTQYPSEIKKCPQCSYHPSSYNGVVMHAPHLAYNGGGFKEEYFGDLASKESNHFWFTSRNALILWGLRKYFPALTSFLEIGCGTGFVISEISRTFPDRRLFASEIYLSGLELAILRSDNVKFIQMDAQNIPYVNEFNVVGAFDVLEHIHDDERVLREIYKSLDDGGGMLLTVPQHPNLWSAADEYACHARRYTSSELHKKIQNAGFKIVFSTSFVTLLLPVIYLSRRNENNIKEFDPSKEFHINKYLNLILSKILMLELVLIKWGMSLPVGSTRFVVARKL